MNKDLKSTLLNICRQIVLCSFYISLSLSVFFGSLFIYSISEDPNVFWVNISLVPMVGFFIITLLDIFASVEEVVNIINIKEDKEDENRTGTD